MTNTPRIVFMGTPDFAATALQSLLDARVSIVAVYTQPPRPKGRGQQIQKSPVHVLADARGISTYTPHTFKKNPAVIESFVALQADLAIVAAYGLILPPEILRAPRLGCVNIHASLLPRWRGASPIQHAIWKGDHETGVTLMQMDAGLDTGLMITKRTVPILAETTATTLHDQLAKLGGEMIVDLVTKLAQEESLAATPQENTQAVYAPLLKKEDGKINWAQTAPDIDRQVRALNPWPGTYTTSKHKKIKILAGSVSDQGHTEAPGTILNVMGDVACGQGTLYRITIVQPENAKPMNVQAALSGRSIEIKGIFE